MEFLYLILYACSNDLTLVTWPWLRLSMIYCCALRLSSLRLSSRVRHHVSELLVPGFGRPVLLCRDKMPRACGMATYVRDGYEAFREPKFECGYCEMLSFIVWGVRLFYHHKPSYNCSVWLHNCLQLRSVGCRPNLCTWWNTWPPVDWCSWPIVLVAVLAPIADR